jgi:tetratricopeptide (TPR) repeat protein
MRWGRSQRNLGLVALNQLGDSEQAVKYFLRAVEIHRACLAGEPGNDVYKREVANSLGQLAGAELTLGHLDKAGVLYRADEAMRGSFSAAMANSIESRRELSGLYENEAELALRKNDLEAAQRLYEQSAQIRDQVLAEKPDFWPAVYDRARSYNNAALLKYPRGRDPAAARAAQKGPRTDRGASRNRPRQPCHAERARPDALLRRQVRPPIRR